MTTGDTQGVAGDQLNLVDISILISATSSMNQSLVSAELKKDNITNKLQSPPKLHKFLNNTAFIDLTTSPCSSDMENGAHALNNVLATEKKYSERFEAYLQKSLLDDGNLMIGETFDESFGSAKQLLYSHVHTLPVSSIAPSHITETHKKSINESMNELESCLKTQKKTDQLFEMRLRSYLLDWVLHCIISPNEVFIILYIYIWF